MVLLGEEGVVLSLREVFSWLVVRTWNLVMANSMGHSILGHCMDADFGR